MLTATARRRRPGASRRGGAPIATADRPELPTGFPQTLPGARSPGDATRAAAWRRVGLAAMLAVVVADAVGLLGVHSTTAAARDGGYHVTVTYPAVARAGWDVPWQVRVQRDGGFGDRPVTLAVTASYFDIFETQRFWPEPAGETRGGSDLYLTFDPPPGDTLVVDYDAYIQPGSQIGRRGRVAVLDSGRPRVAVDFGTFLLP